MHKIKIYRGGSSINFICKNEDVYDSRLEVYKNDKLIFISENVNTDFTNGYVGGILAEGVYYGIRGIRKNGKEAIFIYNKELGIVKDYEKIFWEGLVLPSLIPNPNHKNKKIITGVLIHEGGESWDYSHGCITILKSDFEKFIKLFRINEVVEVELIRENPKNWRIGQKLKIV